MKIKKYSAENLLKQMIELETIDFLGVCRMLNVPLVEIEEVKETTNEECAGTKQDAKPRPFEEIWSNLCDKVEGLNRTQRRNLGALVYAATKKEKN